jgi:integral membrane sensor domain MASE1
MVAMPVGLKFRSTHLAAAIGEHERCLSLLWCRETSLVLHRLVLLPWLRFHEYIVTPVLLWSIPAKNYFYDFYNLRIT